MEVNAEMARDNPVPVEEKLSLIRGVFEHISDAVIIIDSSRTIRAMNPAAKRLVGDGPLQGLIVSCSESLSCRDDDGMPVPASRCYCVNALRADKPLPSFSLQVRDNDDNFVPVSVSASPVPLDDERLVAIIFRDVSAQKQIEAEREKRRRQVELLYSLSQDLAAVADFDVAVRKVLEAVRQLVAADLAGWAEQEKQTGRWFFRAVAAAEPAGQVHLHLHTEARLWGQHQLAQGRLTMGSGPAAPELYALLLPLQRRERVMGALAIASRQERSFNEEEELLLASIAAQLAAAVENARMYAQLYDEAVTSERQRLAAEMHDSLAQTIGIISQRVRDLAGALEVNRTEQAVHLARSVVRAVDQAYSEVRQAIYDLKTPVGMGSDFVTSLGDYLEEFGLSHGLETELRTDTHGSVVLPLQVEVQAFRIVQEALNNVRRHAKARRVSVSFEHSVPGLLRITVADDGVGFQAAARRQPKNHWGLSIMKERAKAVGGLLNIYSQPGQGTRIQLEIPL